MTQDEALKLLKLGENVFLTGAAGSGKTWLLNSYIHHLRSHGVNVAVTASTGIAATHLNGKTIHSWSGIGVRDSLNEDDLDKLAANRRIKDNYRNTSVLVIDEVSMLHPHQLDMVDQVARSLLDPFTPFGGLQVILCGDFFQLPPVSRGRTGETAGFAYEARAWHNGGFKVCYLHEQHRQEDDQLLKILHEIRSGIAGEQTKVPLRTRYKKEPEGNIRATKLYAHNVNVDRINNEELAKLDGKEKKFVMESRGFAQLVEGLKKNCLAPETLKLKIGAEVMFIKNAQDGAFVNGTRGVVEEFSADGGWPVVRTTDGERIVASPEEWQLEENGDIRAAITQVPLRLGWAITIHKSQGMTLDAAEIDLGKAFEPGMGYVALSRVRSLAGLKLMNLNEIALRVNEEILAEDSRLQKQSGEAADFLRAMPEGQREARMAEVLLERFKGSLDKVAVEKKKRAAKVKKPPTHITTRDMLAKEMSLEEIARERGITLGTVLNHVEKLKGLDDLPDIEYLQAHIPENQFGEILAAFEKSEDGKLTPIKRALGEKYSFEDLRVVRLFAW